MDEELKGLAREYLDLYKRELDLAETARNRRLITWRTYWPLAVAILAAALLEPVIMKLFVGAN
jgi:hypothetical protein